MTGTAKVKTPKSDAEFARNTQRRLEQVEHPSSARVGNWVLSTSPETGDLIASNVNGGSVVVANEPEDGGDADVVASGWSHLRLSRQNPQTMTLGAHNAVEWDTVDTQTSDWSVASGSSSIVIPATGIWLINFRLLFRVASTALHECSIMIDGSMRSADRDQPGTAYEPALSCTETFSLSEGSEITATAGKAGSGNFTIGPSGVAPSIVTSLSLTRLPIGA